LNNFGLQSALSVREKHQRIVDNNLMHLEWPSVRLLS
jgi:hypothetical protein